VRRCAACQFVLPNGTTLTPAREAGLVQIAKSLAIGISEPVAGDGRHSRNDHAERAAWAEPSIGGPIDLCGFPFGCGLKASRLGWVAEVVSRELVCRLVKQERA